MVLGVFTIGQAACGRIGFDPSLGEVSLDAGAGCMPGFVDVLRNGGFEDRDIAWTSEQVPADGPHSWFCPKSPILIPHADGMYAGCVGIYPDTEETLGQSVAMPPGHTVMLNGKICIATETAGSTVTDVLTLEVRDGQTVIASLPGFTNRDGHTTCDFVPFSQTAPLTRNPAAATLRISVRHSAGDTTTFYVDDLSLCVGDTP